MSLPLQTFSYVGVPYDQAEDGEEALRKAAEQDPPYAVIVMDNQVRHNLGPRVPRAQSRGAGLAWFPGPPVLARRLV